MRCHPCLLHLLSSVVIGLHSHSGEFHILCQVYLGMYKLIASAEYRWFAENNVFSAHLQVFRQLLCTCKPHYINISSAISEMCNDAFLARPHAEFLKIEELSLYLHKRHLAIYLADFVYLRAVNIFIWIVLQQVTESLDAQFLLQQFLSVRSYARNIHYVLLENVYHCLKMFIRLPAPPLY